MRGNDRRKIKEKKLTKGREDSPPRQHSATFIVPEPDGRLPHTVVIPHGSLA
jgi:hypothetical protein